MDQEARNYSGFYRLLIKLLQKRVKRASGIEKLPKAGPYIIASNHVGSIDPPLTVAMLHKHLGRMVYFVTEQFMIDLLGLRRAVEALGMIPKFEHRKNACLDIALDYLKKNQIVGIYTEGMRNSGPLLLRGKTGTARLALWSKAPVYPMGFVGPQTWSFRQTVGSLLWKMEPQAEIHVGEPLTFPEYYDKPITYDMLRDVTAKILRAIAPLAKKIYPY